jgi:hypothetical protein
MTKLVGYMNITLDYSKKTFENKTDGGQVTRSKSWKIRKQEGAKILDAEAVKSFH